MHDMMHRYDLSIRAAIATAAAALLLGACSKLSLAHYDQVKVGMAYEEVTALIGAQYGFEASSFFVDEGNRPRIGQAFIVVDPGALAGSAHYLDRVELLVAEMLKDEGVRLPGARREALRRTAESQGIEVADAMLISLRA